MIFAGDTLEAAMTKAGQVSRDQPGKYVTLTACFGLFITISDRLHRFAPSDSVGGVYWVNGRKKEFTNAQIIRDQNETPTLA